MSMSTHRMAEAPQRSNFNLNKDSLFKPFIDDQDDYPGGIHYHREAEARNIFQGPTISNRRIFEVERPSLRSMKPQSHDYAGKDSASKQKQTQF